jgi:hypothetical protein
MKVLKTISSLFLAVLVIISSTSFTVGIHFCMGEASDVAVFSSATECEMQQALPPCHRQHKSSCCDDETITHKSEDLKPVSSEDYNVNGSPLVTIQLPMPIRDIVPSVADTPDYSNADHPPLPTPDLVVKHQVFLI